MLVVVEDRNVKACTETFFNFKTLRCFDVFQVNSTKGWGDALHKINNFISGPGINTNRETVHPTKLFKQQGLALHNGHCALRTDIAKTEHRGSVADNGNSVFTDGVLMRERRIIFNRSTDASDAWRIGHRQIITIIHWGCADDLNLSVLMHAESSVPPIKNSDTIEFLHCGNNCLLMLFVSTMHDKTATKNRTANIKTIKSADVSTCFTNGGAQPSKGAWHIVELTIERDRKCSVRESRHKNSHVTD